MLENRLKNNKGFKKFLNFKWSTMIFNLLVNDQTAINNIQEFLSILKINFSNFKIVFKTSIWIRIGYNCLQTETKSWNMNTKLRRWNRIGLNRGCWIFSRRVERWRNGRSRSWHIHFGCCHRIGWIQLRHFLTERRQRSFMPWWFLRRPPILLLRARTTPRRVWSRRGEAAGRRRARARAARTSAALATLPVPTWFADFALFGVFLLGCSVLHIQKINVEIGTLSTLGQELQRSASFLMVGCNVQTFLVILNCRIDFLLVFQPKINDQNLSGVWIEMAWKVAKLKWVYFLILFQDFCFLLWLW